MSQLLYKPVFTIAITAFFCAVAAAVLMQQWWWMTLPVGLLLYIWAFEKPALLFYVLIASVPWSIEYQFSGTLGTDFPDEPLMLLNAFVAISLFVFAGRKRLQARSIHPVLWLLLLQFVWTALTVITSTHPLLSLKFLLAKSWYLLSFVALPLLLPRAKQTVKTVAIVLAASMMVLVLITMIRHAAGGFTFAAINESLAPFFRNHVNYSALLVCVIPLLYFFLNSALSSFLKTLLIICLLICLAALYLSYARGAWVALAAGMAAYGLLKKKLLVAAFVAVLFFVFSSLFWLQHNDRYLQFAHNYNKTIFHTDFREHIVATYQLKDMSTAERFYRWVASVRMVRDGWKTGFGPNTFYHNYRSYTVPAFKTWVSANEEHSTVHNYFLLLLVEQGLFGLLLFIAVLFVSFYTAQQLYHATSDKFWKATVAAVSVILVMICTVNFLSDLIETDKIGSLFYLCLAALVMAYKSSARQISDFAPHIERVA